MRTTSEILSNSAGNCGFSSAILVVLTTEANEHTSCGKGGWISDWGRWGSWCWPSSRETHSDFFCPLFWFHFCAYFQICPKYTFLLSHYWSHSFPALQELFPTLCPFKTHNTITILIYKAAHETQLRVKWPLPSVRSPSSEPWGHTSFTMGRPESSVFPP